MSAHFLLWRFCSLGRAAQHVHEHRNTIRHQAKASGMLTGSADVANVHMPCACRALPQRGFTLDGFIANMPLPANELCMPGLNTMMHLSAE
jgi:hypothetical protein